MSVLKSSEVKGILYLRIYIKFSLYFLHFFLFKKFCIDVSKTLLCFMANNAVKAAFRGTNEFLSTLSDVGDLNIMLLHIWEFCEISAEKDTHFFLA